MRALTFIWGHPVPYSVTVQRGGRSVKDARRYVQQFRDYMRQQSERQVIITRIEGAYIHYDYVR